MAYVSPTWIDVPPGTTPPPGAVLLDAANLQPLSDAVASGSRRFGQVCVNVVEDFGADNTGSSDSRGAIQNAINQVSTAGGGAVFLPLGSFVLASAPLVPKGNVRVFGAGMTLTKIKGSFGSSGTSLFKGVGGTAIANFEVSDLYLDRTGTNVGHGMEIYTATGVRIYRVAVVGSNWASLASGAIIIGGFAAQPANYACADVQVVGCYFEAVDNFGVQLGGINGAVIANNRAKDSYREVVGIEPQTGTTATNVTITGNSLQTGATKFSGSTSSGVIVVTESSGGTVHDVTVTGNSVLGAAVINGDPNPGIAVIGGDAVTVVGNTLRNLNGPGIGVGSAAIGAPVTTGTVIVGNTIKDCNQGSNSSPNDVGIRLRNAAQSLVSGNRISGANHRLPVEETNAPSPSANVVRGNYFNGNASNNPGTLGPGSSWTDNKTDPTQTLPVVSTATTTVTNTTTATTVGTVNIPANPYVGMAWRLVLSGQTDNIATSGTLTFTLAYGGTGIANIVIPTQAGAQTGKAFRIEAEATVRAVGAGGVIVGITRCTSNMSGTTLLGGGAPVTVDTTAAHGLKINANWQTADPGNTLRVEEVLIQQIA